MAPESYDGVMTFKSDIYSLGVIIQDILTGQKECTEVETVRANSQDLAVLYFLRKPLIVNTNLITSSFVTNGYIGIEQLLLKKLILTKQNTPYIWRWVQYYIFLKHGQESCRLY